jgi:hypothetical protein
MTGKSAPSNKTAPSNVTLRLVASLVALGAGIAACLIVILLAQDILG